MPYSLVITLGAGIALLAVIALAFTLVRRAAGAGLPSIGGWRFQPSALGWLVLLPLAGIVLWRFFPAFLFLPVVLPFLLRSGIFRMFRRRGEDDAFGRR